MYEDGKGVAQNDKLALSWYRKAANQGHNQATKDLKALELKIKNKEDEAKTIIPANGYKSGSSFKCLSGYTKRGNFCRVNIQNGYWTYDGSTIKCYSGFKKVGVRCEKELNDNELMPVASGTGFAVTSDGYVVTNNHVVKDCNNVEIYHKGSAIPAIVINVDPIVDLAIIKGNFRPEKFYYLSTKRPRLRMPIEVIGYGFGKKISSYVKVSEGIISSLVGIQNDSSRIQISAALQPGNSGGPIIDENGNVVGVAVEKVSVDWAKENLSAIPENMGFGIKSGALINFLDGNNIEYSTDNKLSFEEIDTLIHGGTYYLSCLMTLSQYEKVKKSRVLFNDLN
jgi:S1-C subfamily serine protease